MKSELPNRVILNVYPDSIDADLSGTVRMLERPEFADAIGLLYILPTIFNSDLDRGFSVVDYGLNSTLVSPSDLEALDRLRIQTKLDLVLNHLSVRSPQFQDILETGDESEFSDFFIDWNTFWEGEGELHEDGYVVPKPEHLEKLFMRKPGLPILQVRFPDGSDRFYWNTFYQRVDIVDGKRTYYGQMDLNAASAKLWDFYRDTIQQLSAYGARILRLDAFAYLHKEVGEANFFNKPGTWDYLERLREIAIDHDLILLPEIHSAYGTAIHRELSDQGFPVYDFFFPGLVIDALDSADNQHLIRWIRELIDQNIKTVNMLGCHDGIPILDLRADATVGGVSSGLLGEERIEEIIELLLDRGGRVKNLYGPDGTKISYYQVNATFFSALGENEDRLRLARAIQLFMPGTPQIWYLDLFAGVNDIEAADLGESAGHKEINRTNLTLSDIEAGLKRRVVADQLEMLRLRNTSDAFDGELEVLPTASNRLFLRWSKGNTTASLDANLSTSAYTITHTQADEQTIISQA